MTLKFLREVVAAKTAAAALWQGESRLLLMMECPEVVRESFGCMSRVFTTLTEVLFEPHGFHAAPPPGDMLPPPTGDRLFAARGLVLQDGGARRAARMYT